MSTSVSSYMAFGVVTVNNSSEELGEILDKAMGIINNHSLYESIHLDYDYNQPVVICIKACQEEVCYPKIKTLPQLESPKPTEVGEFVKFLKENNIEYKDKPQWLWFCQYG